MELKNKKFPFYKAIVILLTITLFFVYIIYFFDRKPGATEIAIGTSTVFAQIADTPHKHSMGLSYTPDIPENGGMLFVFKTSEQRHFWMKDMYFDLDIIWLDENKQVVGFFENVSKDSYNKEKPELSKIYHSPENTKYVLEVKAGTIQKLKIKTGDTLNFSY